MPRKPRLVRGRDYVIDTDGAWEFTREYLLNLKRCCKNKCRYCPYSSGVDEPRDKLRLGTMTAESGCGAPPPSARDR